MTWLKKIFNDILELLFPIECVNCELSGEYLCDKCLEEIEINKVSKCISCNKETLLGRICSDCEEDYYFTRVFISSNYDQNVIHKLIWNLKYNFVQDMSKSLSKVIIRYLNQSKIKEILLLNDIDIIPVSLYKKKLKFRGFNQSLLLAKELSKKVEGWDVNDCILRVKDTKTQTIYNKWERNFNLKDAFTLKEESVLKDTAIIIDDVLTTGSTLNQVAKVLKDNGVKNIYCMVVAKRGLN